MVIPMSSIKLQDTQVPESLDCLKGAGIQLQKPRESCAVRVLDLVWNTAQCNAGLWLHSILLKKKLFSLKIASDLKTSTKHD